LKDETSQLKYTTTLSPDSAPSAPGVLAIPELVSNSEENYLTE